MSKRPVNIIFDPTERLFRRVGLGDLDRDKRIRPGCLRLQLSMCREGYAGEEVVATPEGDRNGYAAIEVAKARFTLPDGVSVEPIDEPLAENASHSLIAFFTRKDVSWAEHQEMTKSARMELTKRFSLIKPPVKPPPVP